MSWNDFSDAEVQSSGDLIPNKTAVKVVMKIRAGGFDDASKGWTGGYATRKDATGAVYLDCEFTVIGGKYNKRKVWSLVGLHSPKGPTWEGMGRSFIRAALESARGINPTDASEIARKARSINNFGDMDGMEFAAIVDVQKGETGYADKNVIQTVMPCTHKDYQAIMSGAGVASAPVGASHLASSAPKAGAPSWAQ